MEALVSFLWAHGIGYKTISYAAVVIGFGFGSLLCLRLRIRRDWLALFLTALPALLAGGALMKLFGFASRALYELSVGHQHSLREIWDAAGYVFYGGLLGYYGGIALYLPRMAPHRQRLGWDILAISFTLFHAVSRIGCYCAHRVVDGAWVWSPCCYGVKMNNAFCALFWESRLPTQLIESAFEFLLFALMLTLLLRGGKKWRGKLPVLYLVAYPVFRYVIEFFRGDEVRGAVGPLSFSQLVSLLILLGVLIASVLRQKGVLKPLPEDAEELDTVSAGPESSPADER